MRLGFRAPLKLREYGVYGVFLCYWAIPYSTSNTGAMCLVDVLEVRQASRVGIMEWKTTEHDMDHWVHAGYYGVGSGRPRTVLMLVGPMIC